MANLPESRYIGGFEPKRYTGKVSVQGPGPYYYGQYKNKPEPPRKPTTSGPAPKGSVRICNDPTCPTCARLERKHKKEVKMSEDSKSYEYQKLYEVITTYGEDRDNVIVKRTDVVAENSERALMQVKDDVESDWDLDYVEQEVEEVAEIRVKRKPRETKEVVK